MKCWRLLLLTAVLAIACEEGPRVEDENGGGGDGDADADPDQQLGTDDCESVLVAVVRDFQSVHPDFHHEGSSVATLGMVEPYLDNDKPVSASGEMYSTNLDQWYRTVDGINMEFTTELQLLKNEADGSYYYDNSEFFPVDGMGFGHDIVEYPEHNWSFTTELRIDFLYEQNQNFTFTGDDDLWVFINGRLAIDVGGIHSPVSAEVNIDDFNSINGMAMVWGKTYPMRIFHAERNPTQSNFHITTSIGCFTTPIV